MLILHCWSFLQSVITNYTYLWLMCIVFYRLAVQFDTGCCLGSESEKLALVSVEYLRIICSVWHRGMTVLTVYVLSWLGQTSADSTVQSSLSMVLLSLCLLTGRHQSVLITQEYTARRHWVMALRCLLAPSFCFSSLIQWRSRSFVRLCLNIL